MKDEQQNDYLWDGSGTPDADVRRLEALLRPFGHRAPAGVWHPGPRSAHVRSRSSLAAAARAVAGLAAAVFVAAFVWFGWGVWRGGWTVQTVAGSPILEGQALDGSGLLRRGQRLVTDGASRARISVGRIGRVDVDPDTRLQLLNPGGRDHRLSLERGTIHAQISAPPRFFSVNTPSSTAVDLGCAYTLHVDDEGAGLLRVTHGWVQFEYAGREAFIPQGAAGATRPGVGPGTPYYEDAPSGYREALALLDFGDADPAARGAAYDLLIRSARKRDALTLWHLLMRGSQDERSRVYERLATLAPPPGGVTRDEVLAGDRAALMAWWDNFGFDGTRWWQRLKKKR